jgi:hypothetical protein
MSRVVRSGAEMTRTAEEWKAGMLENGWTA